MKTKDARSRPLCVEFCRAVDFLEEELGLSEQGLWHGDTNEIIYATATQVSLRKIARELTPTVGYCSNYNTTINSAFIAIVSTNRQSLVEVMLERGTVVLWNNSFFGDCIAAAERFASGAIIRMILDRHLGGQPRDFQTNLLGLAAPRSYERVVRIILDDYGPNFPHYGYDRVTRYTLAAGHEGITTLLLEHRLPLQTPPLLADTPFQDWCMQQNAPECLFWKSLLRTAARRKYEKIVRALLKIQFFIDFNVLGESLKDIFAEHRDLGGSSAVLYAHQTERNLGGGQAPPFLLTPSNAKDIPRRAAMGSMRCKHIHD